MSKQRDWQKKKLASGLCPQCGEPLGRSKHLCDKCLEKATNAETRRRKRANKAGRCARCPSPVDGKKSQTLCLPCLEKQREAQARHRSKKKKPLAILCFDGEEHPLYPC